jgi:hypothetical protein
MPRPNNDWMNDQLRERAGRTVTRDDRAGDEINDAPRVARGYEPRHLANRVRTAEPVGPEPDPATHALRQYRDWLYQHGDLLDAEARLPGESGYDRSTVGEGDTLLLRQRRINRWREAKADGDRT